MEIHSFGFLTRTTLGWLYLVFSRTVLRSKPRNKKYEYRNSKENGEEQGYYNISTELAQSSVTDNMKLIKTVFIRIIDDLSQLQGIFPFVRLALLKYFLFEHNHYKYTNNN